MVSVLEFQFYDYLMTLVSFSYHAKVNVLSKNQDISLQDVIFYFLTLIYGTQLRYK